MTLEQLKTLRSSGSRAFTSSTASSPADNSSRPSGSCTRFERADNQAERTTHWDTWPSPPDLAPATINHCLLNLPPAPSLHTAAFVPPLTLSSSLADTTFLAACTPLSVLEHLAHPIFSRSP